jgi:hypothetical protein
MYSYQCDQRRKSLYKKYLSVGGEGAIYAGYNYTGEEKDSNMQFPMMIIDEKGPDKAGCKEPVIQSLVRGQRFSWLEKVIAQRPPEYFPPPGFPGEHFHPKNIEVLCCYNADQYLSYEIHIMYLMNDKLSIIPR